MKMVRLMKMFLNETYCRLCDIFSIRNGLKQGDTLLPLLFNFALDYPLVGFR
jgi:hypothetical protein